MSAQELLQAALRLSPRERAALTSELALSLEGDARASQAEWTDRWSSELQRRVSGIDSGATRLVADEDVWAQVEDIVGSTLD